MKTAKLDAAELARAIIGCTAAIALTAGATLGVMAELQRGFSSSYEGLEQRREPAVSPLKKFEQARLPAAPTSTDANRT